MVALIPCLEGAMSLFSDAELGALLVRAQDQLRMHRKNDTSAKLLFHPTTDLIEDLMMAVADLMCDKEGVSCSS